jgi:dynein heavy chain 2
VFRELGIAMDSLKMVSSWRGGITGAKQPIKLGGIQLEGCTFDGTRLSENHHDSPSVSTIPPCVVAWVPKVGW